MVKLKAIKKLLWNNGLDWAIESAKFIAALLYKVELCDNRVESYPVETFYNPRSARKAWVLKRNEAINLALEEMRAWNREAGLQLFIVPQNARPWEEDISEQVQAVLRFLSVQEALVAYGQKTIA